MLQGDLRFGVLVLTDAPFATLFKRWERDGQGAFQRAGHASCGDLRQRADGTRTPAGAAWNPASWYTSIPSSR
jgi:hypothetical protein